MASVTSLEFMFFLLLPCFLFSTHLHMQHITCNVHANTGNGGLLGAGYGGYGLGFAPLSSSMPIKDTTIKGL